MALRRGGPGRPLRATGLAVERCFAPLLRWVLVWWRGDRLALAVDATLHGDRLAALVVSVPYRGGAIPVAWAILPANAPGPWLEPILGLLGRLRPAVPATGPTVLGLADRGLWSPRLWQRVRDLGWHPLLRVQNHVTFVPDGGARGAARALVRPGEAWVGRGRLGACQSQRLTVTLIAVWTTAQREPWAVVTDLPPARVGVSWYALRMWVELGFRALKGVGWRWRHTRRTDPRRTARHWLVLAVATLWTLAAGTWQAEAAGLGLPPTQVQTAAPAVGGAAAPARFPRESIFRLGLSWLRVALLTDGPWPRLRLVPTGLPPPPPGLQLTRSAAAGSIVH